MQLKVSSVLLSHLPESKHFVLALSGGVDSCVLLHTLSAFLALHPSYSAHTVYVHHGLSQHADDWAIACQTWSTELGMKCVIERVSLSLENGESVEAEARKQRYLALQKHVQQGDVLLTAQHANDQIETVLLALKRGSGPAGLSAMAEMMSFFDGKLVRPLLSVTREAVMAYAKEHALSWVEDESNTDTRYDRNFLRHCIVPELSQRWGGFHKAVERSARLCGEQEALLNALLADSLAERWQDDGSLLMTPSVSMLKGKALIRLWLKKQDCFMPSEAQLTRVWQDVVCAQADANPKVHFSDGDIRRFQGRLYWVKEDINCLGWRSNVRLNESCVLPENLGILSLNTEAVSSVATSVFGLRLPNENEPISVAFDPSGLTVKPVERTGRRLLKKLFQEYNVPSWQRRCTPLIFYGDQLAAVGGLFVVDGFEGEEVLLSWRK